MAITEERSEFAAIHEEMREINNNLQRILRTLIGDEQMAQEGLVSKVAKHEAFIEQQKLLVAKLSGVALAAGVIGGIIVELVIKNL